MTQGAAGARGEPGEAGLEGPAGSTGKRGPTGLQGLPGLSIAGPPGETGLTGPTGPEGKRGPTGLQGLPGISGPQGIQGEIGPTGATGEDGEIGPTGPQGATGPTGATGATGEAGESSCSQPNYAYIGNRSGNSISVIDPISHMVTATIPLGREFVGMAADSTLRKLYVQGTDGSLTVVDGDANAVAGFGSWRESSAASFAQKRTPAVNPSNHLVYVPVDGVVRVLNGYDNSSVTHISVGGDPSVAAVMPNTNLVYIANHTNTIPVINSNTNTIYTEIKLSGPAARDNAPVVDLQCDVCCNLIYALRGDGSITVINGVCNQPENTFLPEGGATAMAVDSFLGLLYVIDSGGRAVEVFNACKPVGALPISVNRSTRLSALAVNNTTHLVYVADGGNNTAFVADGGSRSLVATVPVGGNPFAAAVLCCEADCPPGSGDCGCCGESTPGPGVFAAEGTVQPLDGSACIAFPNILLDEGGVALLCDPAHAEIQKPGLYALTVRIPVHSAGGDFDLRYALCVNDAAVFEDRLACLNGCGPSYQTGFGHFYVRLAACGCVSLPVLSFTSENPAAQQLMRAYLAIARLGN